MPIPGCRHAPLPRKVSWHRLKEVAMPRAPVSGNRVTETDLPVILAMIARGDRKHDVARLVRSEPRTNQASGGWLLRHAAPGAQQSITAIRIAWSKGTPPEGGRRSCAQASGRSGAESLSG